MKRSSLAFVACTLLALSAAAPSWGSSGGGRNPPGNPTIPTPSERIAGVEPIANKVVDLLDEVVELSPRGRPVWLSAVLDTSQFNRIGVRASGTGDSPLRCTATWQFTSTDEFVRGAPSILVSGIFPPGSVPTPGERDRGPIGGVSGGSQIPAAARTVDLTSTPNGFGEVAGTRVRIQCTIETWVPVGDDPETGTGTGPEGEQDLPTSRPAAITDVKVLLRRE